MLASGAHVKIGSYEFLLDEGADAEGTFPEPHYVHKRPSLFSNRTGLIQGQPGAEDVRPERLVWSFTDWSGGAGSRTFDLQEPNVYDYARGTNTRIRGQIQGRPSRTRTEVTRDTTTHTGDVRTPVRMAIGNNALWVGGDNNFLSYQEAGAAWSQVSDANINLATTEDITAMAGDASHIYYAATDDTSTDFRVLRRQVATAGASTVVVNYTTGTNNDVMDMVIKDGKLYTFRYNLLEEWDLSQALPLTARSNFWGVGDNSLGISDAPLLSIASGLIHSYTSASMVVAGGSIFVLATLYDSDTTLYEFNGDGFSAIWKPPPGVILRKMALANGTLIMVGSRGGLGYDGWAELWGMPISDRVPRFLGNPGRTEGLALQLTQANALNGEQVVFGSGLQGHYFIYDTVKDAWSSFDILNTSYMTATDATPSIPGTMASNTYGSNDAACFEGKVYISVQKAWGTATTDSNLSDTSAILMLEYKDDEAGNLQASTTTASAITVLTSPRHDFNIPYQQKLLMGFNVTYDALTTGQSFQIEYNLDNSGSWTSAGTVDYNHADAAKGRTYVAVSSTASTVKFTRMRWRITLTGARVSSTNYKPPIVYDVAAEALMSGYEETWDLLLRIKDEGGSTRRSKGSFKGSQLRDFILDTAASQTVVSFLDGYRYQNPGSYTTHSVIVEDPIDKIHRNGESSLRVTLRKIQE